MKFLILAVLLLMTPAAIAPTCPTGGGYAGCETCDSTVPAKCDTCTTSTPVKYVLNTGSSTSKCDTCVNVIANCQTCAGGSATALTTCATCTNSFFKNTGTGATADTCTSSCSGSTYAKGTECVANCGTGMFSNIATEIGRAHV